VNTFYPNLRVDRALERFRRRHPEDYEIVESFAMDLLVQGISELRVSSYVSFLARVLDIAGKRLEEFTKSDVRRVIAHYQTRANSGEISQSTVFEVKKTLKKFFKWAGREELVSWFSIGKCSSSLSPQDLITYEEFLRMLRAVRCSRDRALISLLYESGARIGEVASMRVKDVTFDEYGAVVWLPKSKTQRRKLRIVFSARYLAEWLSDHPLKGDGSAPLWVKLTGRNHTEPLDYRSVRAVLTRAARRAGIDKRIYPHLFRHTRATKLLQQVSEVVGAKYMGWAVGTKMVKTYIHLADQDVENAILEIHGIRREGEERELRVVRCHRCGLINPGTAEFCSRCGLPLTQSAASSVSEWSEEKKAILESMADPDVLLQVMGLSRELGRVREAVERSR